MSYPGKWQCANSQHWFRMKVRKKLIREKEKGPSSDHWPWHLTPSAQRSQQDRPRIIRSTGSFTGSANLSRSMWQKTLAPQPPEPCFWWMTPPFPHMLPPLSMLPSNEYCSECKIECCLPQRSTVPRTATLPHVLTPPPLWFPTTPLKAAPVGLSPFLTNLVRLQMFAANFS